MGTVIAALIAGFAIFGVMLLVIRITNNLPSLWSGEAQDIPHLSRLDIYVADETPRSDLSEQDTQEVTRTETLVRVTLPRHDEWIRPTVGILDPLAYIQPCDYASTTPFGVRAPVRVRLNPYCNACYARDGQIAPANGLPRLCVSHQTTMILPVLPLNGSKPAAQHDERKRA